MNVSHDPIITISTLPEAHWGIIKIWHVINGLYVWEFISTLDYEWNVIRGRLPYQWTIWVYSLTRVAALVGVILCLAGMDVTTPIHCQIWISFSAALIYMSAAAASLLVVLRIIAIWNRNKAGMIISITIWIIGSGFHINSVVELRAVWAPAQHTCDPVGTKSSVLSFIPTIISNLVLLLIMLVGLLILRRHGGGTFGLSRVLWKQAVIWLALAIVTEIPPLVLMVLNLNSHLNLVFETPCLITMIIVATRMHRYLIDFAFKTSNLNCQNPQMSSLVFARAKQTDATSATLNRIEVTIHTAFEQHPTARKTDDYPNDTSTNEKGSESPTGPTSDEDSFTIISANKHMSCIVGDSSKLFPSQASTHPLSTASPSQQAQSV